MFRKLYVCLIALIALFCMSLQAPAKAQFFPPGFYVYDIAADSVINWGWTNNGANGTILNYDYSTNTEYAGFVIGVSPLLSVGSYAGHVESAGYFYADPSSSAGVAAFSTFDVGADGSNAIKVVDMFTGKVYIDKSGPVLWGASYIW